VESDVVHDRDGSLIKVDGSVGNLSSVEFFFVLFFISSIFFRVGYNPNILLLLKKKIYIY
jgi:hypothetical protein